MKYISPDGLNFPVVNGGKWNIASNLRGDFNRILSESGVESTDFDSVLLFMKFIEEGMLLVAAKRKGGKMGIPSNESTWLFVPKGMDISPGEVTNAANELVEMFDCPAAFSSSEAFRDNLSDLFLKDFSLKPSKERIVAMTGSRIGYVTFESEAEFEIILSSGYKSQYENFGLILITDNPVPVEAILPRIYLPELMLHRQMVRDAAKIAEKGEESDILDSEEGEVAEEDNPTDDHKINEEDNPTDVNDINEEEKTPDERDISEEELEGARSEDNLKDVKSEGKEGELPEADNVLEVVEDTLQPAVVTPAEEKESDSDRCVKKTGDAPFSMASFWGGFIAATIIYLLIYIVVLLFRGI